jgi:hypothetical protein
MTKGRRTIRAQRGFLHSKSSIHDPNLALMNNKSPPPFVQAEWCLEDSHLPSNAIGALLDAVGGIAPAAIQKLLTSQAPVASSDTALER